MDFHANVQRITEHQVDKPGPVQRVVAIAVRRIFDLLQTMPAARVASTLTAEGVPTPDFGRRRTDRGCTHATSGVWHQTTITNIARNPLISALATYGRRSMGDQLRFSPGGPRALDDADYRADGKPKVVNNPASAIIQAPSAAKFDPIIDPVQQEKVITLLNERAGTQRGKRRSHKPELNPLGCRIFDMNCTWPMYRGSYGTTFRYTCGLYQQSRGAKCDHNHVNGPTATRFLMGCIRQRILSPDALAKFESRLAKKADEERAGVRSTSELVAKQRALADTKANLTKITKNMAIAETPEQYKAIAEVFESLRQQEKRLSAEVSALQRPSVPAPASESDVQSAMASVRRLAELACVPENLKAIGELVGRVNVMLFLGFGKAQHGKRGLVQIPPDRSTKAEHGPGPASKTM